MTSQPIIICAVLVAVVAPQAGASDLALDKCRRVVDPTARLACYDAIPRPVAPAGPGASGPVPAGPAAPVAPNASAAGRFGLPERAREPEVQRVTSRVAADFFGWGPNERIRLENGQVWQVVDGSSGSVSTGGRKVTIRRGVLGSFFLEFEGLNTSPRVRRIE